MNSFRITFFPSYIPLPHFFRLFRSLTTSHSSVSLPLFSLPVSLSVFFFLPSFRVWLASISLICLHCRVTMPGMHRLDWLSSMTWDGFTRMQLVCAFPHPLNHYRNDSFSLCTPTLSALSFTHMAFHTTAICRWPPTNSLFSPIWNTGSSTNLYLTDWHLSVDVHTPPENESWQDLAKFPSRKGLSQPLPYCHHGQLCCSPTQTAKNLGVTLDSQLSLTTNNAATTRNLEIQAAQHQKNTSPSHSEGGAGSGPGSGHFMPRLLQLPPGCSTC